MEMDCTITLMLVVMFIGINGGSAQFPHALCSVHSFNETACITAIKARASDNSLFWYGTKYDERCPADNPDAVDCLNLHSKRQLTLAQALLGIDNPDLSTLDRLVQVAFTSDIGGYTGCDTSYKSDAMVQFSINPLSDRAYKPWDMRSRPEVSWRVDSVYDFYTWIMFDAGFMKSHAIYMNIRGNDFSSASVVHEYSGPTNVRFIPGTYTFMIFKQSGYVDTSSINPAIENFNVAEFARKYDLYGPVALSWALVSTDAYALGIAKDSGLVDNCAALLERDYNENHDKKPFIPDPLADLSVEFSVTFNAPKFTYECGPVSYTIEPTSFTIDPLTKVYKPALIQTNTTRKIRVNPNKFRPSPADLRGKCYALMMADPDVPPPMSKYVGTNERPLGHMLVVNLRPVDGVLSRGNDVLPYLGPLPPDDVPHTYYLLLYEDPNCVTHIDVSRYSGDCPHWLAGRCLFKLDKFVDDLNLKLVGISWLKAKKDRYAECFYSNGAGISKSAVGWILATMLTISTVVRF